MTAGIEIVTGSNAETKVTITDQDIPPGLWLDSFNVSYGATVTKTYSPGVGTKLLVQAYSQNPGVSTIVKMTITGMTLVVSNSQAANGAAGDLWKNGTTIRVSTVTRASGSYVAADWILVGDVTSANTAANSKQLGGKAAVAVFSDISNAKSAADTATSQLTLWKYPNTTEIDGGKIRTNTITANQIEVDSLSALSANLGTFTTVGSDGSKTVMTGGLTQVYYPKGQVAIKLGIW